MGYRSEVTLALKPAAVALFSTLRTRNGFASLLDEADVGEHNDGTESYSWSSIKWYDSYEEISAINRLMDRMDENGMEDEYRFVRVGEDDSDIDTRGYGFEIYVSRSIEWY